MSAPDRHRPSRRSGAVTVPAADSGVPAGHGPPLGGDGSDRAGRRDRSPHDNQVLRPVLTAPEIAPISPEQREQAVHALAAMIVAWLQRRALDDHRVSPS